MCYTALYRKGGGIVKHRVSFSDLNGLITGSECGGEREGGGSLGTYEHGTRTGILVLDIDSQATF